jgi:hypothetical protein
MKLHIFNPEHDLALASNLSNFTAPHAGRQLRQDLGWLPALWAEEDDFILVENVKNAQRSYGRLRIRVGSGKRQFVDKSQLSSLDVTEVHPWGWNLALRSFLLRYGVYAVPSEEYIAGVRELSHRRQAVSLLNSLQEKGTTGLSYETDNMNEIFECQRQYGVIVVKAPWSSSGRGVRFFNAPLNEPQERWVRNVIDHQGSVIVEPYYHKVKDFGMEFESDGQGYVRYLGLSLFYTKNGAYKGNLLMPDDVKMDYISRYISVELLHDVQEKICNELGRLFKNKYKGPFGVDMMIVAQPNGEGLLLHPCVEINLRRTMGHVALSFPPFTDGLPRVMQIVLTDKYRMQVRKRK